MSELGDNKPSDTRRLDILRSVISHPFEILKRRPVSAESGLGESIDKFKLPGLYTREGKPIFLSPTTIQLEAIKAADSRIEYLPFRLPVEAEIVSADQRTILSEAGEEKLPFYQSESVLGTSAGFFIYDYVVPYLLGRLREQFQTKGIVGLRGTACSVDLGRKVVIKGQRINNIAEILRMGIENERNREILTMGFDPNDLRIDLSLSNYRNIQYLIGHPQTLRLKAYNEGKLSEASRVFPVLLVYDYRKLILKQNKPRGSHLELPSSPEERGEAILKAFVLDYPVSDRELGLSH